MAEPRCGWHAEARCLLPDGHDGPHETTRSIIAADPAHLAAPPALDPDVYDLLAAVADPGEAVVERVVPAEGGQQR